MDALQATAMDLDDAAEAPPDPLEVAFEAAANASDPGAAYLAVLTDAEHALTEAGARAKEQCVYKLAERDSKNKNFGDVAVLLERAAPSFGQVAKAKVAKIVRKLLDFVAAHADTVAIASVNGPTSIAISGADAAVAAILKELAAEGVKATRRPTGTPYTPAEEVHE